MRAPRVPGQSRPLFCAAVTAAACFSSGLTGLPHANADDPMVACRAPAPEMKLALEHQPQVSLRDLAEWMTGFTCKAVDGDGVFDGDGDGDGDGDAARRGARLALAAPARERTRYQAVAGLGAALAREVERGGAPLATSIQVR